MRAFLAISLLLSMFAPVILGCRGQAERTLSPLAEMEIAPPPETVSVEIEGYCPQSGRSFHDIFATNFSVKVLQGRLELDSDKDGVADSVELANNVDLNISPFAADSNADGFSDLLMYLSGIDRNQQSRLKCADTADNDGDGVLYGSQFIGLSNCEELRLTGTDPDNFDSDGDTIPDYLEIRCGLNPKDANDALLDPDGDAVLNIDECKKNTPVDESNGYYGIKQFEYKYELDADTSTGVACVTFTISNIPILNDGSDNLLGFYLLEMDGFQKDHLYTAYLPLSSGSAGKTFKFDFGPYPAGRFTEK